MNKQLRLSFQKGDWLAIALVLCMAALTAFFYIYPSTAGESAVVQIYRDGTLIFELPLSADETFEFSGTYTNTISISGGRVAVTDSNCPGADCVHSGSIDSPGRSLVCLPNRVEIRITGAADVDFVVG